MSNLHRRVRNFAGWLTFSTVVTGLSVAEGTLLATILNVLGNVSMSHTASEFGKVNVADLLPDRGDPLANHHLTKAVGVAIAAIIEKEGRDRSLQQKLSPLATTARENWETIAQQVTSQDEGDFTSLAEERLLEFFSVEAIEFGKVKALDVPTWAAFVGELQREANVELLPDTVNELAERLYRIFPQALREVLKQGGEAYRGLMLSAIGEMANRLEGLQAQQAEVKEIVAQLRAVQAGDPKILDECLQAVESGLDEATIAIVRELREMEERIKQTIGEEHQETRTAIVQSKEEIIAVVQEMSQPREGQTSTIVGDTPPSFTHFIGRQTEMQTLTAWLRDENVKLSVIVGLPGVGKSTIAAKLSRELDGFDGKYWVDVSLRPNFSSLARQVLRELVGMSVEVVEQIDELYLNSKLVQALCNCRYLLVFDNLETLLQPDGGWRDSSYQQFFTAWLDHCQQSEILVTTQQIPQLQETAPHHLPLRGLQPDDGAALLQRLGVGGTKEQLKAFSAQADNHPLLLKLVAGFLNAEVGDNPHINELETMGLMELSQLMADPRIQGRHRSSTVYMVAVLDASFNRLPERWQQLLVELTVYRSEFNAEMATAMMSSPTPSLRPSGAQRMEEALPPESSLPRGGASVEQELRWFVKRGLLQGERKDSVWWFEFLPFILAYLQTKQADLNDAHEKAISYYHQHCQPPSTWETDDDVGEYLEIFYHCCQLGDYDRAFDTIYDGSYSRDCVTNLLDRRGYNSSIIELYRELIAGWNPETEKRNWRYTASLTSLGLAYNDLGQYQQAIEFHHPALAIFREIGDRKGEANSLMNLGLAYNDLGQYQQAIEFHQSALAIFREIGNRAGEANSLMNLGLVYNDLRQYQQAIEFHHPALAIFREIGNRAGEAKSLGNSGIAYNALGERQQAIEFHQSALAIFREIGNRAGEANSLMNLGLAYHALGQYQQAIEFHQSALAIFREIGDRGGEAKYLNNLGMVYNALGERQQAIEFYQQSLKIARYIGNRDTEASSLINLGNTYQYLGQY